MGNGYYIYLKKKFVLLNVVECCVNLSLSSDSSRFENTYGRQRHAQLARDRHEFVHVERNGEEIASMIQIFMLNEKKLRLFFFFFFLKNRLEFEHVLLSC